jgi:hypothetical protein
LSKLVPLFVKPPPHKKNGREQISKNLFVHYLTATKTNIHTSQHSQWY